MKELTIFQKKCEETLENHLKTIGLKTNNRVMNEMKKPWSESDKEPYIQADVGELKVWIYEDEAEIQGKNIRKIFEKPDYDSENELMDDFIEEVVLLSKQIK